MIYSCAMQSRRFQRRIHSNKCRVVVLTIFIWLAINIAAMLHYDNLLQTNRHQQSNGNDDDDSVAERNEIDTRSNSTSEWAITISRTYSGNVLKRWQPAPVVPNARRPGEMGKQQTNIDRIKFS